MVCKNWEILFSKLHFITFYCLQFLYIFFCSLFVLRFITPWLLHFFHRFFANDSVEYILHMNLPTLFLCLSVHRGSQHTLVNPASRHRCAITLPTLTAAIVSVVLYNCFDIGNSVVDAERSTVPLLCCR